MAYRRSELKTLITLHAMSMPEQPAAGPAGPNGTPAAPHISPDGIDEEGVVVATAGPTGHDHMLLSKDEVRWGLRCAFGTSSLPRFDLAPREAQDWKECTRGWEGGTHACACVAVVFVSPIIVLMLVRCPSSMAYWISGVLPV